MGGGAMQYPSALSLQPAPAPVENKPTGRARVSKGVPMVRASSKQRASSWERKAGSGRDDNNIGTGRGRVKGAKVETSDAQLCAQYAELYARLPHGLLGATREDLSSAYQDRDLRVFLTYHGVLINNYDAVSKRYQEKTKNETSSKTTNETTHAKKKDKCPLVEQL